MSGGGGGGGARRKRMNYKTATCHDSSDDPAIMESNTPHHHIARVIVNINLQSTSPITTFGGASEKCPYSRSVLITEVPFECM